MAAVQISIKCSKSRNFPAAGPNRGYWLEATCDGGARTTAAVFGSTSPQWGEDGSLRWSVAKARLTAVKAASPLGKLRIDCCAGASVQLGPALPGSFIAQLHKGRGRGRQWQ
jgi:hypothetical protein